MNAPSHPTFLEGGGALCGALLLITASVTVKAIGGVCLLPWDSTLAGGVAVLGRGKATGCLVLGWCRGSGGEGQLLTCSQHPGDGGPDVEVQRLEQQVDSHPCVADDRDATVGYLVVLDPRVQ